jgi:2-haloacid dehalogenase
MTRSGRGRLVPLVLSGLSLFAALTLSGTTAIGSAEVSHLPGAESAPRTRFRAVAFDYFVLFDADSVVAAVDRVFPGKGRAFTDVWRTRQFEYAWLRSMSGRYADFSLLTEDAFVYAANALHVEPTASQKRQLLDAYLHLTPWPDTADGLRRLRESNVRVITIANMSPSMLRANAEHAGLFTLFDALISTDANHTYKPDARAYQLGVDHLRLAKQDVVFAAFGGWDAAGAKSFGYPTVWVNRFNQPPEELGFRPDRTVPDLKGLLEFVLNTGPDRRPVE